MGFPITPVWESRLLTIHISFTLFSTYFFSGSPSSATTSRYHQTKWIERKWEHQSLQDLDKTASRTGQSPWSWKDKTLTEVSFYNWLVDHNTAHPQERGRLTGPSEKRADHVRCQHSAYLKSNDAPYSRPRSLSLEKRQLEWDRDTAADRWDKFQKF